jgi:hypothetical protein
MEPGNASFRRELIPDHARRSIKQMGGLFWADGVLKQV